MCYTLINVPYGALNASLTRDTNEITVLTSVRMFLANLGGLAVAYGIPILVKVLSPDGKINTTASANAWFITMTIYAVIGLALLMFCFNQTKERVVMDQEETSKVKVSDLWVEFCRNKPLRILAFFFITAFAMMAIGNSAGSYYMIYNVRAPEMLPYFMALGSIPAFIFMPMVPAIRNYFENQSPHIPCRNNDSRRFYELRHKDQPYLRFEYRDLLWLLSDSTRQMKCHNHLLPNREYCGS